MRLRKIHVLYTSEIKLKKPKIKRMIDMNENV